MNDTSSQHGTHSSVPGYAAKGNQAEQLSSAMAPGLPPGSYINPAFQQRLYASSTNVYSDYLSHHAQPPAQQASGYPPRDAVGHKRKLDALRGSSPQEKKSKPPTAPSVPSFGAALQPPGMKRPDPRITDSVAKRPANVLGLTPQEGQLQYSSDSEVEEDGIDEEAMFAELGSNLTFEHNGTVLSLRNAADLSAWKAERARNFPTKARMAAKLQQKRQLGEERQRLLTEASEVIRSIRAQRLQARTGSSAKVHNAESKAPQGETSVSHDTRSQRKPEILRSSSVDRTSTLTTTQHIDDSVAQHKVSANLLDEASATGPVGQAGKETLVFPDTGVLAAQKTAFDKRANEEEKIEDSDKASVVSDDSSSVSSDSSSSEDTDNDGPPEEATSKVATVTRGVVCRYFLASGNCRDGNLCRYKHELPAGYKQRQINAAPQQQERDPYRPRLDDVPTARKTIHDRLLEQEQTKEEELVLQVIKYLGKVGLFAKKQ